jgi:UDP-GlcNAc:undecaprenyl-phosphate/decaprenyl-phosphate GlcNAc-1-phosphate transferase
MLSLLSIISGQYLIASFSISLAGAGLGFIYWNRNPAKIYLGDSGALFIGLMLAVSLLQFEPNVESRFASALVPILILALPIIDTSVVVTSRILRGVSIFQGGRDHLSHRLIAKGFSRRSTALLLWIIAALLSMLSLLITIASKDIGIVIALFGLIIMGFLFLQFLRSSLNV